MVFKAISVTLEMSALWGKMLCKQSKYQFYAQVTIQYLKCIWKPTKCTFYISNIPRVYENNVISLGCNLLNMDYGDNIIVLVSLNESFETLKNVWVWNIIDYQNFLL